jgi:arylsulfatase A-like enzyme
LVCDCWARVDILVRGTVGQAAVSSSPALVSSTDFYPTLLALAGLPPRPAQHADGSDFSPVLRGAEDFANPRTTLFWHYPHYHGSTWTPGAAIRDGDWKLIEFFHYGGHELYNLADDLGEHRNLAAENPAKALELLGKLHAWQKELGAKMPVAVGTVSP